MMGKEDDPQALNNRTLMESASKDVVEWAIKKPYKSSYGGNLLGQGRQDHPIFSHYIT